MKSRGFVSIVGAGPGDPGLITKKGFDLLRRAHAVVLDDLVDASLVQGIKGRVYFVGKRGPGSGGGAYKSMTQEGINRLLISLARQGKRVVRLKGGDPFVFGRGAEEASALQAVDIPYEVVPGVTAAVGAPAYAGIPLTDRRLASQVTFITGHEKKEKEFSSGGVDWNRLSPRGTLVVYMGVGSWPAIRKKLLARGFKGATPVAAIESGTTKTQRVIWTHLKESHDEFSSRRLASPALIVVGEVASSRRRLAWFQKERPLVGRRVVVTRPQEQSPVLVRLLQEKGAEVVVSPAIEVESLLHKSPQVRKTIAQIRRGDLRFDGLVFLSANAVRVFSSAFPGRRPSFGSRVVAVGPTTAKTARQLGWRVSRQAPDYNSNSVLTLFAKARGKRVLVPRVEEAPHTFIRGLKAYGVMVRELPIYRTRLVPPTKEGRKAVHNCDAITFTSGSGARSFKKYFSQQERRLIFSRAVAVSLGKQTTAALRRIGVRRVVEAEQSTIPRLVQALGAHFIT